jgi:hypothetical protein
MDNLKLFMVHVLGCCFRVDLAQGERFSLVLAVEGMLRNWVNAQLEMDLGMWADQVNCLVRVGVGQNSFSHAPTAMEAVRRSVQGILDRTKVTSDITAGNTRTVALRTLIGEDIVDEVFVTMLDRQGQLTSEGRWMTREERINHYQHSADDFMVQPNAPVRVRSVTPLYHTTVLSFHVYTHCADGPDDLRTQEERDLANMIGIDWSEEDILF